jgi:hypothetical protein
MSRAWWIVLEMLLFLAQISHGQRTLAGPPPDVESQRIEDCLRATTLTVEFKDTPLQQVIAHFHEVLNLPIVLDRDALAEEGIAMDRPITMSLEEVSAKSILSVILHGVHLALIIEDGTVTVTNERKARGLPVWCNYPIDDLLVTETDYLDERAGDELVQLVVKVIAPSSWQELNGSGQVECRLDSKVLAVYQTRDVQEQVQELLDTLRRLWSEGTYYRQWVPTDL